MNRTDAIKGITAARLRPGLTEAEGADILDAYRRGCTDRQIVEALGTKNTRQNVRALLGTWAIRYCHCHDEKKPTEV